MNKSKQRRQHKQQAMNKNERDQVLLYVAVLLILFVVGFFVHILFPVSEVQTQTQSLPLQNIDEAKQFFRLTYEDIQSEYILVEYTDFQCPYCQSAQSVLTEITSHYESDKLSVVTRHLPIASLHSYAYDAAVAYECALPYLSESESEALKQKMFSTEITSVDVVHETIGSYLDVDSEEFSLCQLSSGKDVVSRDLQVAQFFLLEGTPAFILFNTEDPANNILFYGSVTPSQLQTYMLQLKITA